MVSDPGGPIVGAPVVLEGTSLSDTTVAGGFYTISGVPDPVTYTVIASMGGFEDGTIDRLPVDGGEEGVDFVLTAADGGGDEGAASL